MREPVPATLEYLDRVDELAPEMAQELTSEVIEDFTNRQAGARFADPKCRYCYGKGIIPMRKPQDFKFTMGLCSCVTKRLSGRNYGSIRSSSPSQPSRGNPVSSGSPTVAPGSPETVD